MGRPVVLVSSFWNEEVLMPYWVGHHKGLVDHAVLLDYDSTDRSAEIVKRMAPSWEIRPSRNKTFDFEAMDQEMMEVEGEFGGAWKIVLTTTEFLVAHNLRKHLDKLDSLDVNGVLPRGCAVVDKFKYQAVGLDNSPLMLQRGTTGYWDTWGTRGPRSRVLHRCESGLYTVGRHFSRVPSIPYPDFVVLWFSWSPYSSIRQRKLRMKTKFPVGHISHGRNTHDVTEEHIDAEYAKEAGLAYSLMDYPQYASQFRIIEAKYETQRLLTGVDSPIVPW